jgi:hypothetical protein
VPDPRKLNLQLLRDGAVCLRHTGVEPGHKLLGVLVIAAGVDEAVSRQVALVPGKDLLPVLLQALPVCLLVSASAVAVCWSFFRAAKASSAAGPCQRSPR